MEGLFLYNFLSKRMDGPLLSRFDAFVSGRMDGPLVSWQVCKEPEHILSTKWAVGFFSQWLAHIYFDPVSIGLGGSVWAKLVGPVNFCYPFVDSQLISNVFKH